MARSIPPPEHASRWMRFGSLPFAAGLLVFLNALYILFVTFGNVTDFGTNQLFVQHVLSMDTTNFGAGQGLQLDDDVMWRAIENRTVQNVLYVLIIAWEFLTTMVLCAAVLLWFRDAKNGYRRARATSTVGVLMLIALFFGGFIAIGGEWFQMWKSVEWNGIDAAFRNAMLAMVTLVVIHLPSSHWNETA